MCVYMCVKKLLSVGLGLIYHEIFAEHDSDTGSRESIVVKYVLCARLFERTRHKDRVCSVMYSETPTLTRPAARNTFTRFNLHKHTLP